MNHCYVEVYVAADGIDCTNHGITSKHTHLYLYDGDHDECLAHAKAKGIEDKALYLVRRMLWNERHYYAEPLIKPEDKAQVFGGNFIYTCDGAFSRLINESTCRPLPVHDRFETWEMFEALSR